MREREEPVEGEREREGHLQLLMQLAYREPPKNSFANEVHHSSKFKPRSLISCRHFSLDPVTPVNAPTTPTPPARNFSRLAA